MEHTIRKKVWVKLLALLLVFSMSCTILQNVWPFKQPVVNHPGIITNPQITETGEIMETSNRLPQDEENGDVFAIELSEGSSSPQEIIPIEPVKGEPLTQAEINVILARLPEMEMQADDQVEFRLPPEVLPPPRPGNTIEHSFSS